MKKLARQPSIRVGGPLPIINTSQKESLMEFEELLALAKSDERPDDIFEQIATTYNDLVEGGQLSLSQREATIEAQRQENLRLKSLAYDRMMSTGEDKQDDEESPPDKPQGIASLFTYETRQRRY